MKMNQKGKRTVFLSGEDSQERREECIERLVSDTIPQERRLDYIITVDIFNEGVDIPEVNQVIMMRPTESPVIFVQQLGRGLRKAKEKDYHGNLTKAEQQLITFISQKLTKGKRPEELMIIRDILDGSETDFRLSVYKDKIYSRLGHRESTEALLSAVRNLTNRFAKDSERSKYSDCVFLQSDGNGGYKVSDELRGMMRDPDFNRQVKQLTDIGIRNYRKNYSHPYKDTNLSLYQKYTYEDVCRLLHWERNEPPLNIGGYKYDRTTKTFPVFINYVKDENIQDTVKYEDHFESPERLIAISKSKRSIDSEDVQNFLHAIERGISVELFVRKNKDDKISKEFYYLGHMKATGEVKEFIMPNTTSSAVEIAWALDNPVRNDLYEYITG